MDQQDSILFTENISAIVLGSKMNGSQVNGSHGTISHVTSEDIVFATLYSVMVFFRVLGNAVSQFSSVK